MESILEDYWRKFEWFVTRIESIIRSTSAISRFVTNTLTESGGGADWDQQAQDVWRELVHLYQQWGKISKATEDDNIRAEACNDASGKGAVFHWTPVTCMLASVIYLRACHLMVIEAAGLDGHVP